MTVIEMITVTIVALCVGATVAIVWKSDQPERSRRNRPKFPVWTHHQTKKYRKDT